MKSLKNHISFIIPLFAILFAAEFYLIINKVIKNYEKELSQDYSIIVVSKKALSLDDIQKKVSDAVRIKEVDSTTILSKLKKQNSAIDLEAIKTFLPKFYKVYLGHYPSNEELKRIKEALKLIDGVTRVEVFSKTHQKIYNFLLFIKKISKLFLTIIFVTSIMLVFKQIEVWNLEHKERMYIMALFGAPLWMRNAILIKLSIIDTILSTLLVYGVYFYLFSSNYLQNLLGTENLEFGFDSLAGDMLYLFGLGLFISFVNIFIVSLRQSGR